MVPFLGTLNDRFRFEGLGFRVMVPFLGSLNDRCRIIIWTQKGAKILTTTQMVPHGRLQVKSCISFHEALIASLKVWF